MPQRVGEYRHRTIIQRNTATRDPDTGEKLRAWSSFATRWAKRRDDSGTEGFQDATTLAEHRATWRMHMTRGVSPTMRMLTPGAGTTLTSAVSSATDTSLDVDSSDGFPLGGNYRVRVEDELMTVTSGQGTTTWTVERGVDGTSAATSYATGTAVSHMEAWDIEDAWIDWQMGAETVLRARSQDRGS